MNTAQAVYPSYAALPSPHPPTPTKDLTLIAASSAERFSGLFAKAAALAWGFRHLAKDAEKLAVELITRAVETTGNPDPYLRYTELLKNPPPLIGIRVSMRDHGLLIDVWNSDPTPPRDPYLDNHLSTVAAISRQWNCYPISGGKVIWAELVMPQQPQARPAAISTNRRYSYPAPETPVEPLRDVPFMRRVRDGLHRLDTDRNSSADSTRLGSSSI